MPNLKEIDLVPESKRSPAQYMRTALIQKHLAEIQDLVMEPVGLTLADTAVLVMDEVAKNLIVPNHTTPPSEDSIYLALGPRTGLRAHLEIVLPIPKGGALAKLDDPPPPHCITVVVVAFGGLTLTALGDFIVVNTAPPPPASN
jgi:hypothetical protein